ncbi:MAG TPA: DUF2163 domain-containing protein [Croceibacterium sp.]|nr:DUF2163 domain-containing protein [Croceibacterium sp.]
MTRVFFREELETVATFWRIARTDGVTLGFTSHDKDLLFDGVVHRAAPGMLPSAIRRTSGVGGDSAEVEGALTHDALSQEDLANARFDGSRIAIGAIDWQTLERTVLYRGEVGAIGEEGGKFTAELRSAKAVLEADPVPRTSPTCRAQFCGPGCTLSAAKFTHEAAVSAIDLDANRVSFAAGPSAAAMLDGYLRWLDGPQAGLRMEVISSDDTGLVLDVALDPALQVGTRAMLREGCDHTLATCVSRFANSVNFQGEPYLPGNDLLARYGTGG